MQCRRIINRGHRYWNIKGCGEAEWFLASNCLFCREKGMWRLFSEMWHKCATSGNRGNTWQNVEPNEASSFRAKSFESEYAKGPRKPGSGNPCLLRGFNYIQRGSSHRTRLGSVFPIAKWDSNLIVTLGPAKYVKRGGFLFDSCTTPGRDLALGIESYDHPGECHCSHPALWGTIVIGGADAGNEKVRSMGAIDRKAAKSVCAVRRCSCGTFSSCNR